MQSNKRTLVIAVVVALFTMAGAAVAATVSTSGDDNAGNRLYQYGSYPRGPW